MPRFTKRLSAALLALGALPALAAMPPTAPAITTAATLASATAGEPYAWAITATGNPAPTFALGTGSSLPDWLTLNPATGALTGTPPAGSRDGRYSFTVMAGNGVGSDVPRHFTLPVRAGGAAAAPAPMPGGVTLALTAFAEMALIALVLALARRAALRRYRRRGGWSARTAAQPAPQKPPEAAPGVWGRLFGGK